MRARFRRKGAYGAFKHLLVESGLLESWYAYRDQRTLEAIRDWCESEGLQPSAGGG